MKIILQGTPKRKVKFNVAETVMFLMFVVLPIILLIGAVIMFVIHLFRLNYNIFVAIFELISDAFGVRTGWFFADGATFASVYKDNALEYTFRMALSAFILFMGGSVINAQCPYCSHFFTLKRISEDEYEGTTERKVSNTYYEYGDAVSMDLRGNLYYTQLHKKNRQYGTEVTDHYTYKVKCSCCGCVAKTYASKSHVNWD